MAFVAGGTWLFSEPQRHLHTLVDLLSFQWTPVEEQADCLRVAATCTIDELSRYGERSDWPAAKLFSRCARSLAASFKVCNVATVGGNICLALPAASLLALAVALDGVAEIWRADGTDYKIALEHFALGPQRTVLRPGDVLRAVLLPVSALRRQVAMRQMAQSAHGRSGALLIGTKDGCDSDLCLTITASTQRPVVLRWQRTPTSDEVDHQLDQLATTLWLHDGAAGPAWRRQVTRLLAHELIEELAE